MWVATFHEKILTLGCPSNVLENCIDFVQKLMMQAVLVMPNLSASFDWILVSSELTKIKMCSFAVIDPFLSLLRCCILLA